MTIPVQQFQILTPEQANPFGQGMKTGEEIYRNFVTNKYLPEQLQQQARQRELANQTNEVTLQNLPDILKQQLMGQKLTNQMNQMKASSPFMLNPEGALYDYAFKQQQQQQQQDPQGQMGQSQSGQPQLGNNQGNNGSSPLNNNLFNNILSQNFMSPEQKAAIQVQNASKIDEIKQNNRDYQKELNTASIDADTNRRLEKSIDQLASSYKNLTPKQRGPIYGHLPALSSESQIADNAANNLQAEMAKIIQSGGRNTNFLTKFAGTLKPNRAMSPESVDQLTEGLRANSRRQQERPGFLVAARERGIDAQMAKELWNQYDEQNPVYDFNKRQVNKYKDKSYMDYLSDKAVNAVKQGESYKPDMVKIHAPNGQDYMISRDKLDAALKRGAKQAS